MVAESVTFWSAGPAGSTIPELLYGSNPEIPRSLSGPVSENPTLVPGSVIVLSVYGSDPEIPKSVFDPVSENPTLLFRGGRSRGRGLGMRRYCRGTSDYRLLSLLSYHDQLL
jgi:hypothetical protein